MKLSKNVIQLRHGFVNLPNNKKANHALAMSVASELMQFGYLLDQNAIANMSRSSKEKIVEFHNEVIDYLKEMTGSKRGYKPFWKGFPEEVMSMSESELWMHQIVYYLTNCKYEPTEWTKERPTAFEQPKYTVLVAGDEDKFLNIFTKIVSLNQSLTPEDNQIVSWFIENGVELRMPNVIPFKETLCTTISSMIKSGKYEFA